MVEFGGGFVIGGAGLQWLVWIQLLVMILLIVLIYNFSLYALEAGDGDVMVSAAEEVVEAGEGGVGMLLIGGDGDRRVEKEDTSFMRRGLKIGGSSSIRGEISTSSVSRRIVRRSHGGIEADVASIKDINHNNAITEAHHHPCAIFKFAREAFLKCLGLDCMAEDTTGKKTEKN